MDQHREEDAPSAQLESADPKLLFPRTDSWRRALRAALTAPRLPLREGHAEALSHSESDELSRWVTELQEGQEHDAPIKLDDLYRRIANATHEGIWLINAQGKTVFVNQTLAALLGYSPADLRDRSYLEFVPDYAIARARELLDVNSRTNALRMRADLLRCDGSVIHMMASTTAIHDDSGELFGMLAMLSDITELKQTQESILAAHQSLEEKVEARTAELAEINARLQREAHAREAALQALQESESRYRLLAENSLDMISAHDLQWRFHYVSPVCETLLGYEPAELIGQSAYNLIHTEDQQLVESVHLELLNGLATQAQVDYRVRHSQGHWIWFESKMRAVADPKSGEVLQLIVNSRDITDRKSVERKLRQVKSKLETRVQERTDALTRSMLALRLGNVERKETEKQLLLLTRAIASAGQGIIVTDPDPGSNKIIYANPAFYTLTGYEPEEVIGQNCRFLQGPETNRDVIARIRQAILRGKPFTGEVLNYRKDGSPFWNSLHINPIVDDDGEITQFVGVLTDVTDSRELEDRLQQARKMESLGTLAGGVAHDFNNMLTPILGYSELLLQTANLAPEHRDWIETMARTARRSRELISQILAFTRQKVQQRTSVDLRELVEESLSIVRAAAPSRIKFSVEAQGGPFFVYADPTQLHQAILNLCTNAVYEMTKDGGELSMQLQRVDLAPNTQARWGRELPAGAYVQISVSDSGKGIPADVLERIWDPFYTTKPGDDGTGMGLPEVLGIVTAHEGGIAVDTAAGQGTTFSIVLPCDLYPSPETAISKEHNRQQHSSGQGEQLLLIEDEEVVAEVMTDLLESLNYRVMAASSGASARALFQSAKDEFACVLCDQSLPDATGLELLSEMRAQAPAMPFLIYTGNPSQHILSRAKELGIKEVLSKPVDLSTIARALEQALV